MLMLFGGQDVHDLVNDSYDMLVAYATEAQRNTYRELRKKDQKALFYIHQCVGVLEKIVDSTTANAARDILVRCYGGDASVKKVKLQSLHKQYVNINMKNNEKIPDYISKVILITNQMKSCGETLSEHVIIEKALRSLTPQFDQIVVAVKHYKDMSTMRIEEMQSSLEVQESCLTERTSEREVEQALKVSSGKKNQKQSWYEANKRHVGGYHKEEVSNSDENKHQKRKEKFDKKKAQCYCCKKFGHFAADVSQTKKGNQKKQT